MAALDRTSRTKELQRDRDRFVARGIGSTVSGFAESAAGAAVIDVDGRTYLDFATGISVMNLGHGHPRVTEAIVAQARRLVHSGAPVMMPEGYVRLARRLCEITPGAFAKKALLVNSGAEAVENAIKVVRQATGRPAIISFHHAFHGRTLMTMSVTGKVAPYKQNFGPYAPEVYQVPYPYEYRRPSGMAAESLGGACVQAIAELFRTTVPAERVAGVLVEPVLGEGGFVVPPPDFLPRLRDLCRAANVPLIVDEVQTGFGRTGRMFASEHLGIEPDVMTMAKSMGGGLPIAAVVGRADLMDATAPGGLGGTFGGNPVACAAALAVIDVLLEEQLPQRGAQLGGRALQRMRAWQDRFACIGDVRGLGAMVAMELVRDRSTREPASALTADLLHAAHARGLIVIRAGLYDNVVRLLFPLNLGEAELERGLDVLEASLAEVTAKAAVSA
ncbi:MAG TPA: 4-aminobutyrate--2-oxoglutarate transaminase [Candidatus Limnocylindrales bacterium]|nr:4-aminobutyrate--2-oxoglutarate transaminase [Candidatus Limnocylindrales bacterium]